jgi:hypothetical protein
MGIFILMKSCKRERSMGEKFARIEYETDQIKERIQI